MRNSVRKASLFIGVIALFLQATVGIACGIQCAFDCAESAKVAASKAESHHCAGHGEKENQDGANKHQCNGSCQSIGACDTATVPPPISSATNYQVLDVPVIIPDELESVVTRLIVVPGHYSTDPGPPGYHIFQTLGSRAPPVA
ncbi:MAG: hypothetical protein KF836_06350 [Fimbriimonadaceae bacterium]|nr:hypothetical protein [Fimbriimonadaceae bacterium]